MLKPPDFDVHNGPYAWDAIVAAASGDVLELRRLTGLDPGLARAEYGRPALLGYAVREGQLEAVRFLLEAGADPDFMETAEERGYDEIATLLEEARARWRRVVPSVESDHPVHQAAEAGDLKRVREFLDADPSLVHRSDRSGGTPLHRAVIGRSRPVVELLLNRGADIHAIHGAGLGSSSGYAPQDFQAIDLAVWGGPRRVLPSRWRMLWGCVKGWLRGKPQRQAGPCDVEMARLLLARGATHDLPIASALGDIKRVMEILDEDPSRLRETRPNGRLALSAAAQFGQDAIARLLLERGSDPTWPDAEGSPRGAALHVAARAGNRPLVELLLKHGADPNGYVDAAGNAVYAAKTVEIRKLLMGHGGTLDPYDLVWMDEDEEAMRRILEDPASANAGCGGVFTAVVTRGKRDLLVRLLDAGIRVPPVAGGCQSYLLERPDLLRLLLKSGMSPDYPTWEMKTLLHCLCDRDVRGRTMDHRTECAAILVDAGANISIRDEEFRSTPLAWAARNNLPDMVEFLLSRGAPANLPDDKPWATPLAWATRRGYTRIVETLRAAGART